LIFPQKENSSANESQLSYIWVKNKSRPADSKTPKDLNTGLGGVSLQIRGDSTEAAYLEQFNRSISGHSQLSENRLLNCLWLNK